MLNSKRIRLIFDGSVLTNGLKKDSGRSGVYFMADRLLREFCRNENIEVTVLLPECSDYELSLLKNGGIIPQSCNTIPAFNSPKIYKKLSEYCMNGRNNFIKKLLRFARIRLIRIFKILCFLTLKKRLDNNCFDIYFSPVNKISPIIQNAKNIKYYIIIHDLIPLILKDFYESFGIKRMRKTAEMLQKLNPDFRYFTNSESTKYNLLEYHKNFKSENIIVAYPASNHYKNNCTDNITPEMVKKIYNIPPDKKYILSFSTVEPRKNIIFAIKNFITFIDKYNIEDLVFVAGGGVWNEYKELFEKFMASVPKEKFIKLDYVDDNSVGALYTEAFLFVCPSIYEGFGTPILEAMQSGCPVITSNKSSLPEVIGDAGITIDPNNDKEMIAAYKKMYYDENFRQQCIKKGLERAKLFTWEKCADIMYNEFHRAIQNETSI